MGKTDSNSRSEITDIDHNFRNNPSLTGFCSVGKLDSTVHNFTNNIPKHIFESDVRYVLHYSQSTIPDDDNHSKNKVKCVDYTSKSK